MQTYEARNGKQVGFELSPKWIRVMLGGEFVADSRRACILLPGGPPHYYFPKGDVRMDLLRPTDYIRHSSLLGDASYWSVVLGDRTAENAVWGYPEPVSSSLDLSGHVAFDWDKMDAWFEENEEVFFHPHDPYKRIDILRSTRHVVVVIGGETVAASKNPTLLFETGLPTRYYLPKTDVRMDLLVPSDKTTGCAYK